MLTHVAAMGKAGARIAEALIYAAMANVLKKDVRIVLIGADKAEESRLETRVKDYARVSDHLRGLDAPGFSVRLELAAWPEEARSRSLNDQAQTRAEKLLCAALFTREQTFLSPAHALDASGPVAAMTWEALLSEGDCGALEPMRGEGGQVIMVGSLCEAVCFAGVSALPRWLGRKADAVLLLGENRAEDTSLCQAALRAEGLRGGIGSLVLLGLPEDCRTEEDSGASLCQWLAAVSVGGLPDGAEGTYAWQVPCAAAAWPGEDALAFLPAYDRLTRACCLIATVYGSQMKEALRSPKWLRDKLTAWYGTHFGAAHTMDEEARNALLEDVEALLRLTHAFVGWMETVQDTLPAVIRWHEALKEKQAKAAAHYAHVMDTAGQIAWLQFEAQRSGMAEEKFVHRHDLSDSAAEETIRQIEDLKEKLAAQLEEQKALNAEAGDRMIRAMLRELLADAEKEAGQLSEQAQEGRRRVARAAEIADAEEMSKIETARTRLDRMERHVALLNGRVKRIRDDLTCYGRLEGRKGQEGQPDTEPTGVYPPEMVKTARLLLEEGADAKKLGQRMLTLWPWKDVPVRAITGRVAREKNGSDCLGSFLSVLLSAAGKETL